MKKLLRQDWKPLRSGALSFGDAALGAVVLGTLLLVPFPRAEALEAESSTVTFPAKPDRSSFYVDEAGLIAPSEGKAINEIAANILKEEKIPILAIVIVGFAGGAALATWFPILRLPFVSRKEMRAEVERAAGEAFHRFRVRRTAGGTGVVIFVSLYERMVTVLPADAIAEKVVPGEWEAVRDLVLQGIRERRSGHGFSRAIAKCGEILKPLFPIQPGDVNEISNELRVLD